MPWVRTKLRVISARSVTLALSVIAAVAAFMRFTPLLRELALIVVVVIAAAEWWHLHREP